MKIIRIIILLILIIPNTQTLANDHSFEEWVKNFKKYALKKKNSEETFNKTMSKVNFLEKIKKLEKI